MTAVEFITGMYCDSCLYDGPQAMTEENAAHNLQQYREEGLQVPPTVTPRLFARVWNIYYKKDIAKEGDTK